MLTLIGLGLNDENDMTLKGIEAAKNADKVFIEFYTGLWHGNKENLEKIIGTKIIELQRKDLEDDSEKFLQNAKNSNIALLVQGDPLIATSHEALVIEARKMKIETKVIHNYPLHAHEQKPTPAPAWIAHPARLRTEDH